MRSILIFLVSAQAFPQQLPRFGWYADLANDVRTLRGVSGNFLPGAVELSGARSVTGSGVLAVADVGGRLAAVQRGREVAMVEGTGPVAVSGERAIAWLAGRESWAMYDNGEWQMVHYPAPPEGVERLSWNGGASYYAAMRDRLLEIRFEDGALLHSRDLESLPLAILDGGGFIQPEGSGLRIVLRDGSEQLLSLGAEAVRADAINPEWFCVRLADERIQLVRVRPSAAQIFELPAPPVAEVLP